MYGHQMGFGLGFLNFIGTILFFVTVFWALRFFFRGGFRGGGCGSRGRYGKHWSKQRHGGRGWNEQDSEADKVIRERLAKGEISQDEFTRLRGQVNDAPSGETNRGRPEAGPLGWLRGDDALEVARLRLAKGEINADEFEGIRRALTS